MIGRRVLLAAPVSASGLARADQPRRPPPTAMGPLVRAADSGTNAIWLARPDGSVPVLVGSHNWAAPFQDYHSGDPPAQLGFARFLEWYRANAWTFVRGWRWENTRDDTWSSAPHPWRRTGPGNANDGHPKFDLTKFDVTWDRRYQRRLQALVDAGIYVGVMLYNQWSINSSETAAKNNWLSHPFHPGNNINGISALGGDKLEWAYDLGNASLKAVHEAYLRHMVDICNPYDNVIYETCNEPWNSSMHVEFFRWVVDFIHSYQGNHKTRRHPVWFSTPAPWMINPNDGTEQDNSAAVDSNAEVAGVYLDERNPRLNGNRPWIADTDHSFGIGGSPDWCWRMFTRGCQGVLNMDSLTGTGIPNPLDFAAAVRNPPRGMLDNRYAMTAIRLSVDRVGGSLRDFGPRTSFASTCFALVKPNARCIVYNPNGGSFTVDLSGWSGGFRATWLKAFDSSLSWVTGVIVRGGASRTMNPPPGVSGNASILLLTPTG